eukprot:GHRQ01024913.1.p1 GENE.GHRQ01024913.1~~GHRQ01024913.1.p1  ORF type:complete len:166 (+),score=17.59 GHRQ01024913.1:568-1065(+)
MGSLAQTGSIRMADPSCGGSKGFFFRFSYESLLKGVIRQFLRSVSMRHAIAHSLNCTIFCQASGASSMPRQASPVKSESNEQLLCLASTSLQPTTLALPLSMPQQQRVEVSMNMTQLSIQTTSPGADVAATPAVCYWHAQLPCSLKPCLMEYPHAILQAHAIRST